jgi:uncharacterized protein (UPF0335 family)
MGLFKKVKVWWKRHVVPGLSGRMEEVENQLKEIVANQKQSDARIAELETKLQEQIQRNVRVETLLRAYIITLGETEKESVRKTSPEENGQKEIQGSSANQELMENTQGEYTEVKQMGNDWKIVSQIKRLRGRMRRQNPVCGQKEIQGSSANQELMENTQEEYTEVKQMGSDWKIASQIKRLRGRMRRQSRAESSK